MPRLERSDGWPTGAECHARFPWAGWSAGSGLLSRSGFEMDALTWSGEGMGGGEERSEHLAVLAAKGIAYLHRLIKSVKGAEAVKLVA